MSQWCHRDPSSNYGSPVTKLAKQFSALCFKQGWHTSEPELYNTVLLYLFLFLWLVLQSELCNMNMLTTTAEERESISDVRIVLLMAAVQREQILSCWMWLEKREAICSNNPLIVLHYSQRFAFSSSFSSSVFTSVFLLSSVSPSYFFHFSFLVIW